MRISHIGVMGAGAWGTALAQVAATAGRAVTLWAFEPELPQAIVRTRENALYLPGVRLLDAIAPTGDLTALAQCDAVLATSPAQHARALLARFAPIARPGLPIVLCAKGVEQGTLKLMSEVLAEAAPEAAPAVLSGPGFAGDVARGLPTATTIACADPALAAGLVEAIGLATFRPYLSDDLTGAQLGGAVKNVIAIACGVAHGRRLGDGARAALITRGFAEMSRLGRAMGARQETMNGLSGLGDLVLTCTGLTSRNMSLGAALGEGRSFAEAIAGKRSVAEGAASAPAVVALAAKHGVEMPICAAVAAVLSGALGVEAAIEQLLTRPFRAEGG